MFLKYYQLHEQPFGVTPDPRYLYLSQTHREALASLIYGIETGRGILALIGKPGMGKTTLLFQLLERWRSSARTIFFFQTQCDSRELLRYLLSDMGVDSQTLDPVQMHAQLKEVLMQEAQAGRRVVLFIDEAQNLEDSVLESVRLLSDFETASTKLLQIVLAGQPELAGKLVRPGLAQLRQRVSIISRLQPFTPAESNDYIQHRLLIAGYKGSTLFTPQARAMLVDQGEGIPRKINNLCFNALSLGYALNRKPIDHSIMQEVIADLDVAPLIMEQHASRAPIAAESPASTPPLSSRVETSRASRWAFRAIGLAGMFVLAGSFSVSVYHKPVGIQPDRNADEITQPETLTVVVEPKETLSQISLRYLGRFDANLYKEICGLNPELVDPNLIQAGQQIRLPRPPGGPRGAATKGGDGEAGQDGEFKRVRVVQHE
jgi:type II secretory pathway predicted ATPase ExeA